MNILTVKNGIELAHFDNYTLYKMYTKNNTKFFICLPSSQQETYQMMIDFPEAYYTSLLEQEKIDEINHICDTLYESNYNAIYVLPNITTYDLQEFKSENDNHAYQNLLKALYEYTSQTYNALKDNPGMNINQAICIISQTDDDKKLINWLDINMPGYFTSIDYSRVLEKDTNNGDDGWTTLGGPTEGATKNDTANKKNNHKVRILVPSKMGFLNFTFILITISLFVAFVLAVLLFK